MPSGASRAIGHKYLSSSVLAAGAMLLSGCMAGKMGSEMAGAPPASNADLPPVAAAGPFADPLGADIRAMGSAVYQDNCAACHDAGLGHAPNSQALALLSPENILHTLTDGRMAEQAAALSADEKAAVAQVVTNRPLGAAELAAPVLMCSGQAARFDRSEPPIYSGWGLDADNSHSMSTQSAGIDAGNVSGLTLKWAFAFPNAIDARSQPALAGGAIYVGGNDGTFYALDRETGCARWTYQAGSGVRTGIVVSEWDASDASAVPMIYFGDSLGNAYGLNAETGAEVWVTRAGDSGIATLTGTPALHGDTLYVPISSNEEGAAALPTYECCTFRGSLLALDSATGAVRWRTHFVDEPTLQGENSIGTAQYGPSGAAVWSAPLVNPERGLVYVATSDNYSQPASDLSDAVVAMDMATGAIRWANQVTPGDSWNVGCWAGASGPNCPEDAGEDFDFGAAPLLAEGSDGRTYLLAGQKSGIAFAFDPDTGERVWERQVGRGGELGGVHFGIAAGNGRLYVPISDLENGAVYEGEARPGVYALDIANGDLLWSAPAPNPCDEKAGCQPGYSASISVTPELVFAGSTDGYLRILSTENGALLWEEDTDVEYRTVNGSMAHGGSMSGGTAPIAHDGTLILNSGYAFLGKLPGNVLLVYSVD